MKYLLNIIFSCISTVAVATAAPTVSPAQQADDLYRQADYTAAIEAYEALLAEGMTNADLHYNLGNAYYREGEMGRAILHYERALRLRPSMADAKENLALANSHTADRITPVPQIFFVRWYHQLLAATTPALWRTVWLVLFALLGAAVVGLRLGHSLAIRKSALATVLAAALLLAASSAILINSSIRANRHTDAIILEPAVSVKSSPEPQSADKLILHEGTKVQILEQLSDWYKIRIADGTTGWCLAETTERI